MSRILLLITAVTIVVAGLLLGETIMQIFATEGETGEVADGAEYLGVSACRKCHIKEYMSWKKTTMANALNTLKPGVAAETKKNFGLDPQADYTTDPECLPCHVTGYGKPGGYVIPGTDKKSRKRAKENEGVACEGCHGPGSNYIALHKEVMTKKRKYSPAEFYAAGMKKMDAASCTSCHNPDNPTAPADYKFDYAREKDEGMHEIRPLKYRKD